MADHRRVPDFFAVHIGGQGRDDSVEGSNLEVRARRVTRRSVDLDQVDAVMLGQFGRGPAPTRPREQARG